MAARRLSAVCAFFLSCFLVTTLANDKKFPDMTKFGFVAYQTEVHVTSVTLQAVAYAKEYIDIIEMRGRLDILAVGSRLSLFYYDETKEIVEVNSTSCVTWIQDESRYFYEPIFYGWLNKNPLIMGPSASLWYAQGKNTKYEGQEVVRAIQCDKFSLQIQGPKENATIYYYFADNKWTTPYNSEDVIVPIRTVAIGSYADGISTQMLPFHLITDFAYFQPFISDLQTLQVPEGLGCSLRQQTIPIPSIPNYFRFSVEKYDALEAEQTVEFPYEYGEVWYDQLQRFGILEAYNRNGHVSEFHDFSAGVIYRTLNDATCSIRPLRNSPFQESSGAFKDPKEIFGLLDAAYYIGKKEIRGIPAHVFENIQKDEIYKGQTLAKLVTTIYFSDNNLNIAEIGNIPGEISIQIPLYTLITGYNEKNEVTVKEELNFFRFLDVLWPDPFESFELRKYFPLTQDKAYVVLIIDVEPRIVADIKEQSDGFIEELLSQTVRIAKIARRRVDFLVASYRKSEIFVNLLIVDRPPALKQFFLEYEGQTTSHDPYMKAVVEASSQESCASACVGEGDFPCTAFFFCNEACFLTSEEKEESKQFDLGNCQTWRKAYGRSTYLDTDLDYALSSLENAVMSSKFYLYVPLSNKGTVRLKVKDIVVGGGPFNGNETGEEPYRKVINYAKLDKNNDLTEEVPSANSLGDCHQACKKSRSMGCASFSFCPDANDKQCIINPTLIVNRMNNIDDTIDDKNCFIYSLNYLEFYYPYPGTMPMIKGDEEVRRISTAEECAENCIQKKNFRCRSFEFCKSSQTCVLHTKHVRDLGPDVLTGSKDHKCKHYAAKFIADYIDFGTILVDDNSDTRKEVSLEECAMVCSTEKRESCSSFNYCPSNGWEESSSCSLSSKKLSDRNVVTTRKGKCLHYEKRKDVYDWVTKDLEVKVGSESGFTKAGFIGLIVGLLVAGLVASLVLLGVMYYCIVSSGSGGRSSAQNSKKERKELNLMGKPNSKVSQL